MGYQNAWSNPNPAEAARMAAFLEERSRYPDQVQVNAEIVEVLAPTVGERLLEVGCGSGVLCRLVAPHLLPDGTITGLDISPDFVAAARAYTTGDGTSAAIAYEVGPGEALPYPDATFDGAFAARLILHASDPDGVVREMARVTRPGGRVVLMDWDFETVAVDHPDRALTRRILNWRTDHHGGNNWSGRQLLRRMVRGGLYNITVMPVVTIARDESSALTQSLWRAAEVTRDGGAITAAEHDAWIDELKEEIKAGHFFASIVYFTVRGVRPHG